MKFKKIMGMLFLSTLSALFTMQSNAQVTPSNSPALYLQYGHAEHGTDSYTLGILLPWHDWSYQLGNGLVTGYWDISASDWSAILHGERTNTWVIEAKPSLRWRPHQGQSPFFFEAGLGVSLATNHIYRTDNKDFSTRINFATHLGIGYMFGEQKLNEISLRFEHHSNAAIKQPNPGENFLQLRYARRF